MDKKKRNQIIFNVGAFIIFIALVYFLLIPKPVISADEEIAKCIGTNSLVYVQTGCSHCEDQLALFGNYTNYLNQIDCVQTPEKCGEIQGTPTWKINGKLYPGVQQISTLKSLTGC